VCVCVLGLWAWAWARGKVQHGSRSGGGGARGPPTRECAGLEKYLYGTFLTFFFSWTREVLPPRLNTTSRFYIIEEIRPALPRTQRSHSFDNLIDAERLIDSLLLSIFPSLPQPKHEQITPENKSNLGETPARFTSTIVSALESLGFPSLLQGLSGARGDVQ
jgi:hypothetical protein